MMDTNGDIPVMGELVIRFLPDGSYQIATRGTVPPPFLIDALEYVKHQAISSRLEANRKASSQKILGPTGEKIPLQ